MLDSNSRLSKLVSHWCVICGDACIQITDKSLLVHYEPKEHPLMVWWVTAAAAVAADFAVESVHTHAS